MSTVVRTECYGECTPSTNYTECGQRAQCVTQSKIVTASSCSCAAVPTCAAHLPACADQVPACAESRNAPEHLAHNGLVKVGDSPGFGQGVQRGMLTHLVLVLLEVGLQPHCQHQVVQPSDGPRPLQILRGCGEAGGAAH